MHYFDFFGLPVAFRVDESALRRTYLENSRKYHPDFHTLSGDAEQAEMLDRSTLNNEGYKILSDPDRRMRYVLEINGLLGDGIALPELPADFLMDMMEINEALMELEFDFDDARFQAALNGVQELETALDQSVWPVLEGWEASQGAGALGAVLDYYLKKRYLLRIRENLSKFAPR